jgi:pantetheine-phosphate adenylyltransferase
LIVAIYPGTFDPVHYGHIDIALRAARLFDRLVVGIYDRPQKSLLFSTEERAALAREALAGVPNIVVEPYSGLTVGFARQQGARVLVRGLRVISDFEVEYQMAHTSRRLDPEIDMVCLMTSLEYAFVSSTIVKDIASAGGDVLQFVPPNVDAALKERLARQR